MTTIPDPEVERAGGLGLRDELSSLHGLLALSMRLHESTNEQAVLDLVSTSVASFGHARFHGAFLRGDWPAVAGRGPVPALRADLEAQFVVLTDAGGPVSIADEPWGWAFPFRSREGLFGYLVVGADGAPSPADQLLLRVLAQQAGIALANAELHRREHAATTELRAANAALADSVAALQRSTAIHDRLTRVAAAGEGLAGIAEALYELTGYPVSIEDDYGNLRAWSGPGPPTSAFEGSPDARGDVLGRAERLGEPIRYGDRLLTVARPHPDVLGVLTLVDPDARAGADAHVALEHGATVLAMELARLRGLAEIELRLGRDLVEELLEGADSELVLNRAQSLGYDLARPHRVVVVGAVGTDVDRALLDAVRRVARNADVGSLVVKRGGVVVLLSTADVSWVEFRGAVVAELGRGDCRVGVGGIGLDPADVPRSYREARLALNLQMAVGAGSSTTSFEELGVYRLLSEVEDSQGIERFVHEWLGALLAYDADKGSSLVPTLAQYLHSGMNHQAASSALAVHRNTLKYRLQRISEVSGHDLSDPDTDFNLQLACRALETLVAVGGGVDPA